MSWILSDFVFSEGYWREYVISPVISFQCAVAVNFAISYFYVWKDRTRTGPDAGKRRFFRLFVLYDLSGSAVFLLRLGLMLLVERFTGILNFTIENLLIFRKKKAA